MKTGVRTTIVYGLFSAVAVVPVASLLAPAMGWALAFKLALWADLCGYALLLARFSRTPAIKLIFPLGLLLGMAAWPGLYGLFFFVGLGVFSWLRSGICCDRWPVRAMIAELVTVGGGAGLVALLGPGGMLTWAISIWLFFLVQALYFFMVPVKSGRSGVRVSDDGFETALRQARELLDG